MSISDTIGPVVASSPVAAVARQSGDTSASAHTGVVFGQAQEVAQLLASLQPHLGQNVSTTA